MNALLIVDIQHDFLPGGALAVNDGDKIIPVVNKLQRKFDLVIATQDWHPKNHESFASNHSNGNIGQLIDLHGLPQVLWPDHCIQDSHGAEFGTDLNTDLIQKVFRKGTDPGVDSYSGFFDNDKAHDTGLFSYLQSKNVTKVFVVGLATDYCVKYTAKDAASLGFEATVILDAVKAVNLQPNDEKIALKTMEQAGVLIKNSYELAL